MIQFGNKTADTILIGNKDVLRITIGGKVAFEKSSPPPSVDYLYIQNTYAGQNTITFTTTKTGSPSSTYYSDSVEYSKNGFDFTTLNFVEGTPSTLTLEEGEKLYLRNDSGTWNYYSSSNTNYHTTITCSQTHTVGGNIKSLVDYTDMTSAMQYSGCFSYLFDGDSTLTSSSNLVMDDDTMVSYAYLYTFQNCTSMTSTVSSLPATTLAGNCYNHMYYYCSALTAAPSLPATSVTASAYQFMFSYCNSLTAAPSISATEVGQRGMYAMFSRCASLTTAVLLVTTAGNEAFKQMFYYCSAFNSVTTEITDISATDCLSDWLFGVSNTGTLYNNGSATYTPNSASGIPTGWTEVKPTPPTPTVDYLYIQNTYAGQNTITLETIEGGITPPANTHATSVEYSKDLTNWTTITFVTGSGNAQTITMNQGEKVYFRNSSGKFNYESTTNGNYRTSFKNSESCVVGGDVRTIIDYNNYQTVTLPQGCFYQLFSGNTELTDASALKLPSTAIPDFGYKMMFNANLNLTAAPDIDATSVGEFGCDWMFKSCILLQTAPELKSATLSTGSYERMFQGCSLLNSVTIDANDISAEFCLLDWLDGVAATGDFYNNGSATYPSGSSGIPTGWTVHTPL